MSEQVSGLSELDEFANEVGKFICYWGYKKIHGRVWTYIYLSSQPVDAGYLMQRLKVSKALISLTLNDLLNHNVIKDAGKSARGTQTYVANPDILSIILEILKQRERRMLAQAENSHKLLSALSEDNIENLGLRTDRLAAVGRLIDHAQDTLTSMLELTSVDLKGWKNLSDRDEQQIVQSS